MATNLHQHHPAHVFMAEDNPGDVDLMKAAFSSLGVAVDMEIAPDGSDAVSRLSDPRHPPPDLIMINFNLPKLLGCEVLAIIKHDDRLRRVPVVVVSTSDSPRDRIRCSDADAYFVKGMDWDDQLRLAQEIRRFLPERL